LVILEQASVVVLARNYNPSIASKDWLVEKAVLTGKVNDFTHTPIISIVEEELVNFLLTPDRLQLSAKAEGVEGAEKILMATRRFVDALPETPYVAVGLNCRYRVSDQRIVLDRLVTGNDENLKSLFGNDYSLSCSLRFPLSSFRATAHIPSNHGEGDFEHIGFNFHRDVGGHDETVEALTQLTDIIKRADDIVARIITDGSE
jgi:hypothetical protein